MAEVIAKINPKTGERTYEIQGVTGESCSDITSLLIENNEQLDHQYTEDYCVPDVLPEYAEDAFGEE